MSDFLVALYDPHMTFLRYALLVGVCASVSFGMIGSYVVVRRISYIAGAIAHCVLGGLGLGLYLQKAHGFLWADPLLGAVLSALLAALIIGLVSLKAQQREDTVIGALWAIGMAFGLIFLSQTPGYTDPMSYLFGNILLVSQKDVYLVLSLDAVILVAGVLFYQRFLAVCFDEEYARIRGVRASIYYLGLLCLTALTVVLLVRVVGVVMVVALLTLPAAIASHFARTLWQMMLVASFLCAGFISGGLALSYSYDLPSGPVIIILAGAAYLLVILGRRFLPGRV